MKRFVKTAFAAILATFATQTYAANSSVNVSPEERTKIETVVHEYLVKKPEVLVEALQTLQRRQYEDAQKTVKKTQQEASQFAGALFNQANDPVAGNPKGKVTVVEFFDYQCPHCVDMAPTIETIIKTNPDVRIVFKEFPIRGPMSETAARAALAANMQGKYYEFSHALLIANQPLTDDNIFQIAKNTGLDVDKLKKDMSSGTVDNQLKANLKLAQDLKLFGTPAFFIGKTDVAQNKGSINYIPGQMDQTQLQKEIDKVK